MIRDLNADDSRFVHALIMPDKDLPHAAARPAFMREYDPDFARADRVESGVAAKDRQGPGRNTVPASACAFVAGEQ